MSALRCTALPLSAIGACEARRRFVPPCPPSTSCRSAVAPQLQRLSSSSRHAELLQPLRVAAPDSMPAAEHAISAQDADSRQFAIEAAKVADMTKCTDIIVLHVAPVISWTSYMVIATVNSKPQLMACMARVEEMGLEKFDRKRQNEPGNSPWEVLDFGDVCVQVFTPEQREYYDIESFYATCEEVDLPFAGEVSQVPEQQQQGGTTAAPSWTKKY